MCCDGAEHLVDQHADSGAWSNSSGHGTGSFGIAHIPTNGGETALVFPLNSMYILLSTNTTLHCHQQLLFRIYDLMHCRDHRRPTSAVPTVSSSVILMNFIQWVKLLRGYANDTNYACWCAHLSRREADCRLRTDKWAAKHLRVLTGIRDCVWREGEKQRKKQTHLGVVQIQTSTCTMFASFSSYVYCVRSCFTVIRFTLHYIYR